MSEHVAGGGKKERGPLTRTLAIAIALLFLFTLIPPNTGAATTFVFVEPSASETVSGKIQVEVKMDSYPDAADLYIDDIYFTDMEYVGFDGTYYFYRYDLDTWGLHDGAHVLRVTAREGTSTSSGGISFFVDNYAPQISDLELLLPKGQMALKKGDLLTVTVRVTDTVSGIKEVICDASKLQSSATIFMYDDGQHNDTVEGDGIFGTSPFVVNALTNGYNLLYVEATDNQGNDRLTSIPVAMDNHPPDFKDRVVIYPVGQSAVKEGDMIRLTSFVEDRGEGGMLRIGTDIVLVLDNSGSMINPTPPPMDDLKDAVDKFITMTHPEDRVAIFAFSNNAAYPPLYESTKMYLPYTNMDAEGKQAARDVLFDNYEFNMAHNTPIWDTIGEGMQYAVSNSEHQPVVVAFTDGVDYGYDWYARPDPTWWQKGYDYGFSGLGFERGSENFAPWNDWGSTVRHEYHHGEYMAPWPDDDEVHWFDVPVADDEPWNYSGNPGDEEDRDWSTGLRKGLLNSPLPVFTVGLGLPHHVPLLENTTEYDLSGIATTSANESIRGRYYYAPDPEDLNDIYKDISSFINLAGDINVSPPGGIVKIKADAGVLGQEMDKPLYDDGDHDDVFEDDEIFGTNMFDVKTGITEHVNVTIQAIDIVGFKRSRDVEVLVDNTPPLIHNLTAYVMDQETGDITKRYFASDGDRVFFTVRAGDLGNVSGLTTVLLDAIPLGGDGAFIMHDDGIGHDYHANDGEFTSGNFTIVTDNADEYIMVTATAYDIAKNTASAEGNILILNNLDIVGQIVEPMDDDYIRGYQRIELAVSDDTNVESVRLVIEPLPPVNDLVDKFEVIMARSDDTGNYRAFWNTTQVPDGEYLLSGIIFTRAETEILTPNITVMVDNTPPVVEIQAPDDETILNRTVELKVLVYDTYAGDLTGPKDRLSTVQYDIDGSGFKPLDDGFWVLNDPTYLGKIDPWAMDEGVHVITVRAYDMARWESKDNITVYTDTTPPILTPVYIPPTDTNISEEFMFGFMAEDTTGIEEAYLFLDDDETRLAIPYNPSTGLYEYNLDTASLEDGNHTYCVMVKDRVGLESEYCDRFIVDNSQVVKPPKKDKDLNEMPWWVWILIGIAVVMVIVSLAMVYRDRVWMRRMEEEMIDRAGARKEPRPPPVDGAKAKTSKLPQPKLPDGMALPPLLLPTKAESRKKGKGKGKGKKGETVMEISTGGLAPMVAETKAVEEEVVVEEVERKEKGSKKKRTRRFVKCPICSSRIRVTSTERPLVLTCETCGSTGRLK